VASLRNFSALLALRTGGDRQYLTVAYKYCKFGYDWMADFYTCPTAGVLRSSVQAIAQWRRFTTKNSQNTWLR